MKALVLAMLLAALPVAGQEPSPTVPATRTLTLRPLLPPDASVARDRAHRLRVAVPPGWIRGDTGWESWGCGPRSALTAGSCT